MGDVQDKAYEDDFQLKKKKKKPDVDQDLAVGSFSTISQFEKRKPPMDAVRSLKLFMCVN